MSSSFRGEGDIYHVSPLAPHLLDNNDAPTPAELRDIVVKLSEKRSQLVTAITSIYALEDEMEEAKLKRAVLSRIVQQYESLASPMHRFPPERSQLTTVITNIYTLEDQMEEAREIRAALSTFLQKHETLVSPMRRFPPELLSEVFFWCLPVDRDSAPPSSKTAPLTVSQVCRTWRCIALDNSGLWNIAAFVSSKPSSGKTCATLMQLWVTRSGKRPLELAFKQDYTTRSMSVPLQILMKYMVRCRRLDLSLPFAVLKSLPAKDFPILESLTVHSDKPSSFGPIEAFSRCSSLRSCALYADYKATWEGGRPRTHLSLPYAKLTYLHLESVYTLRHVIEVFQRCKALEVCELVQCPCDLLEAGVAVNLPIVRMPALRTLRVTTFERMDSFFDFLDLPSLHDLKLLTNGALMSPTIAALFDRSHCLLNTLDIAFMEQFFASPADFLTLARLVPSLTELSIQAYNPSGLQFLDDTVLNELAYDLDEPTFPATILPSLRSLYIRIVTENHFASSSADSASQAGPLNAAVGTMLSSRCKQAALDSGHKCAYLEDAYIVLDLSLKAPRIWYLCESGMGVHMVRNDHEEYED